MMKSDEGLSLILAMAESMVSSASSAIRLVSEMEAFPVSLTPNIAHLSERVSIWSLMATTGPSHGTELQTGHRCEYDRRADNAKPDQIACALAMGLCQLIESFDIIVDRSSNRGQQNR